MNACGEINRLCNPELSGTGKTPDGWSFVSPRPALACRHRVAEADAGGRSLVIEANGDPRAFGCWRGRADLEVGKWYKAGVRVRAVDIAQPSLSIFARVAMHFLVPVRKEEGDIQMQQVFRHAEEEDGGDVEFYLRAAEGGRVEWFDPCVVEVPKPRTRKARVATVRFGDVVTPITLEEQRARIAEKLEQAGTLKPDMVALPEITPLVGLRQEDCKPYWNVSEPVPDGPTCRALADAAKRHSMYVLAGVIERRGDYLFNTAVLFDRRGELAGQYDKTHLTFGELTDGISCGTQYPVFDLDFGRIGVHICYDEWFPEVARYYAHAGCEILFLPVAGGKPITWRTRAMDNGIYFVSSSITPPSMIIDSSGAIIAETHGDGIACAELDLDYRQTNWYGDPTLSYGVPCVVPQMRNVLDNGLLDRLAEGMKRA